MMYLSGARHSRAPEDRLQKMTDFPGDKDLDMW